MARRLSIWLVLPVAAAVAVGVAPSSAAASGAAAEAAANGGGSGHSTAGRTPELSVSDQLGNRRFVAAGTRAYSIGFEDGRFYANGWHITGEMGGVWTPPLKLVDGVWFGLDGQWVGPATKFSSGWGYTRYDLPDTAGLERAAHRLRAGRPARRAVRPQDHQPGRGADREAVRRRALRADGPVPVGIHRRHAERQRQPPRHRAATTASDLVFTDDGALPGRADAPLRGAGRHLADARRPAPSATSSGDRSPATAAPAPSRARRPTPSHRSATTARSATAPVAS